MVAVVVVAVDVEAAGASAVDVAAAAGAVDMAVDVAAVDMGVVDTEVVVEDMATLSALKSPLGLLKFILIVSNKCSHRATAGLSHGLDGRTR